MFPALTLDLSKHWTFFFKTARRMYSEQHNLTAHWQNEHSTMAFDIKVTKINWEENQEEEKKDKTGSFRRLTCKNFVNSFEPNVRANCMSCSP